MRKLNNQKLTTLVVTLLLFVFHSIAQNRVVTGTVTDQNGKGIPGVTVSVKGTTIATQTDSEGGYRINAPENATLVFSAVGFGSSELPLGGKTSLDAALTPATNNMDEVVVIGYGTARKRDLTGAVSTVQAKDFNKGNFTAPDQLIQGKVAGLMVINNTGQPGGATTVKIRGNSAITGTGQPLYVIDGVPIDGRSVQPGFASPQLGNTPGANALNFINPSDIASMDVLKDASATAIYGSRGAYGVIFITTKKGVSGQPKIDFNTSVGVSSIMKKIDVLDANQFRQALTYYGVPASNDKGGNVDALDAILRKGLQQNYNIAVSGGNENGRYRLSLGYLDQEGIVVKSNFRKYSANFAGGFKFLESKKLGVDFNIIPSQYTINYVPIVNDAGANGSLIGNALQWNPTEPLRKANDSLNINYATNVLNPLAISEAYDDVAKVTTILASISPYFKFNNWLEYRMLYSLNYGIGTRRASIKQFINLNDINGRGWAAVADGELTTQQITHTLNFNKQIATGLNLNALAGFEYMKFVNKGSQINAFGPSNGGFGNFGLDYTNYLQYSNSSARNLSSFADPKTELQSYFARTIFNFKDKYFLTATFRADGSTKFGENNKYGYFPSFALAWNLGKEDFFDFGFFNSLKIRGGWGKTGNQEFPAGSAQAKYSFQNNGGIGQTNNPNPFLQWQSDRQYNIGMDFEKLNSRLSGTVDYFNKMTTDLLFPSAPIQPAPPGSVVRWINLDGQIVNRGLEASVNASIVRKRDFAWDFGVNATFIKNEVSGLPAPIATGALHGQGISGTTVQVIRNGLPINAFFTREFVELDKTTGQAVYTDQGSTFFYVGDPNPSTLLGITTSLQYKKLGLTINMNGAFGQDVYNNTLNNVINVGSINRGRNIAVSVYESPVKEAFSNPVTASSRFIEDASYLKLANATISYGVGNVGKIFKGANIYLTGTNLFVITDFQGFDPEVNVDKNVNGVPSVGIEYTPYPSARTIIFGINFSL
jgi:TonB-linked SusC/RagA family outer membrane protein